MANEQQQQQQNTSDTEQQQAAGQQQSASDSGLPGGGVGRREGPFNTPVYPISADEGAAGDATVESENAWGQGERGAAGYQDSGGSGLEDIGQMEHEAEQQGGQQSGSQQASQQ